MNCYNFQAFVQNEWVGWKEECPRLRAAPTLSKSCSRSSLFRAAALTLRGREWIFILDHLTTIARSQGTFHNVCFDRAFDQENAVEWNVKYSATYPSNGKAKLRIVDLDSESGVSLWSASKQRVVAAKQDSRVPNRTVISTLDKGWWQVLWWTRISQIKWKKVVVITLKLL